MMLSVVLDEIVFLLIILFRFNLRFVRTHKVVVGDCVDHNRLLSFLDLGALDPGGCE